MKPLSIDNIMNRDLEGTVGVILNKEVEGRKYFKILRPVEILLSDGEIVTIPVGFTFDGSSTPKYLECFLPRFGSFMFAALIHDWLYVIDYKRDDIGIKEAQKFADDEMLKWSKVLNNKTRWKRLDNVLRYKAVRLFGKKVYKERSSKY